MKAGFNIDEIKPVVVKEIICETVTKLDSLKGRVRTDGIINPQRAIELVEKIIKENKPSTSITMELVKTYLSQ